MQQLIKNLRGVSPVIGALMLTLITITAAGSFAVFVSQKQEMMQEQQFENLKREMEEIDILRIDEPTYDSSEELQSINITVRNNYIEKTRPTTIAIENNLLKKFKVLRSNGIVEEWVYSNGSLGLNKKWDETTTLIYNASDTSCWVWDSDKNKLKKPGFTFELNHYEQVEILINDPTINFNQPILENNPFTIRISSTLGNIFEKTFYPPTSIIKVVTEPLWNSTGLKYESFIILDGSLSDHPGDGYVVEWGWNVTEYATLNFNNTLSGRKVSSPYNNIDTITLEVVDNYGMKGKSILEL